MLKVPLWNAKCEYRVLGAFWKHVRGRLRARWDPSKGLPHSILYSLRVKKQFWGCSAHWPVAESACAEDRTAWTSTSGRPGTFWAKDLRRRSSSSGALAGLPWLKCCMTPSMELEVKDSTIMCVKCATLLACWLKTPQWCPLLFLHSSNPLLSPGRGNRSSDHWQGT